MLCDLFLVIHTFLWLGSYSHPTSACAFSSNITKKFRGNKRWYLQLMFAFSKIRWQRSNKNANADVACEWAFNNWFIKRRNNNSNWISNWTYYGNPEINIIRLKYAMIQQKINWKQMSPSSIGLLAMSICLRCFSKPCHWNELYRREFSDICGMFCNVRSLYSGWATRCSNNRPRKEVVILARNMCNFQKRETQYQRQLNVSWK